MEIRDEGSSRALRKQVILNRAYLLLQYLLCRDKAYGYHSSHTHWRAISDRFKARKGLIYLAQDSPMTAGELNHNKGASPNSECPAHTGRHIPPTTVTL